VDTCGNKPRSWMVEAKRRITEVSFEGKASVAELSQKYVVNANQIFQRRKQSREGLGCRINGYTIPPSVTIKVQYSEYNNQAFLSCPIITFRKCSDGKS